MWCNQYANNCESCLFNKCIFICFKTGASMCVFNTTEILRNVDYVLEPGNEILCGKISPLPTTTQTPIQSQLPTTSIYLGIIF